MALVEEDNGCGVPEWVVTFGDMMSLLLTFFIMLVSMSEIKEEQKYQAMVESLTKRFGYDTSIQSFAPGQSHPRNAMIAKVANDGRARRLNVMQGGDRTQAPTGDHQRVRIIRQGAKTNIGTVIFFDEWSADLSETAQNELDAVVQALGGKPQKIEIRGHTSKKPLPSSSPCKNHWELAYTRCWNTYRYLTEEKKIDPERIRIAVAGPYEPMHIGSDPLAQRENPRVEVFMLDETVSDLTGTKEEQEKRFTDGSLP